jgi:hypothetical protein
VSPGIGRIAVVVALVAGGIAVLTAGFDTSAPAPAGSGSHPTSSPSASPSSPSPAPAPRKTGVSIAVYNGTSSAGIAAQVQQTLQHDGYLPAQQPTNSPVTPINKTTIYYRNDANAAQNRSDAQYIAHKYFKDARVEKLGDSFPSLAKDASVAIVLGQDYIAAGSG